MYTEMRMSVAHQQARCQHPATAESLQCAAFCPWCSSCCVYLDCCAQWQPHRVYVRAHTTAMSCCSHCSWLWPGCCFTPKTLPRIILCYWLTWGIVHPSGCLTAALSSSVPRMRAVRWDTCRLNFRRAVSSSSSV